MTPAALARLRRLVELRRQLAEGRLERTRAALKSVGRDQADLDAGDPAPVAQEDAAAFALLARRERWRDQRRLALAAARAELETRAGAQHEALARARGADQALARIAAKAEKARRQRAARRAEQWAPVTSPDARFR